MEDSYFSRQNEKKSLTYLKAGMYCYKRERELTYFIIIFSVILSIAGVVFSLLPQAMRYTEPDKIEQHRQFIDMCNAVVRYSGFGSGMFLMLQLLIKVITRNLHVTGVNAMERFDNYIYGLVPNRMIMRSIPEAQMDNYAAKVRKKDSNFYNTYFSSETPSDPEIVFNNQREMFINEYHLLLFVKTRFFNFIWFSFFIGIFGFALAVNSNFFSTLLDVFFPSISIISVIVSSMLSYYESMRFLNNTLSYYESTQYRQDIVKSDPTTLRLNQDAVFSYRMSSFTVPMFLIKLYDRSKSKKRRLALTDCNTSVPKTSPFIIDKKKNRDKNSNANNDECIMLSFEPENSDKSEQEQMPEPIVERLKVKADEIKPKPKAPQSRQRAASKPKLEPKADALPVEQSVVESKVEKPIRRGTKNS